MTVTTDRNCMYCVNGRYMSEATFKAVFEEFFKPEAFAEILQRLKANGEASITVKPKGEIGDLSIALDAARNKIAVLEKIVAQLILENLYLKNSVD